MVPFSIIFVGEFCVTIYSAEALTREAGSVKILISEDLPLIY